MDRTITFRLIPTGKKERFLEDLSEEMAELANYVVEKYMEELHGEVKLSRSVLQKGFVRQNAEFYLGSQSDMLSKSRYFTSVVEKIKPNLKNHIKGRTNRPDFNTLLYFSTRIVEFEKTDSGYWGIEINHPSQRDKVFIKLAENDRNEEKVKKVIEAGGEDTFTCEIHKNDNGKWILSAMIGVGESPSPPSQIEHIIGADLGLRFVATASVMDTSRGIKDVKFLKGGEIFKKRKELNRRMQELQKKGEKKAYNRLKDKDGEIMRQKNHSVSKELVEWAEQYKPCIIVFEDLEDSKNSMKEETFKESGELKGSAGRYRNRLLSFWSPSMLKEFVEYKAEEKGIEVYNVDPEYTSQTCPECGQTSRDNRKNSKHRFVCQECGYEINDDLVGSVNIARKGAYKVDVDYVTDLTIKEFEVKTGGEETVSA